MVNKTVLMISRRVEGGMKTHLEILIRGLLLDNYQVSIVTPVNNLDLPRAVKIHRLNIPEYPFQASFPGTVRYIKNLILQEQFGIVHTHGYAAGIAGRLAAIFAGKKELVHTVHNFFPDVTPLISYGAGIAEAWFSAYTKKIITVSEKLKEKEISLGVRPDKVVTVYNGIDTNIFRKYDKQKSRALLGLSVDEHVIGTVSRLIPAKGIDIFLKALALQNKKKALKGLIIGNGPEKAALQNLAHELGLSEKVLFLGHRTDVPELLSALDIFILPSLREGFGLVLLESQCIGLPVIASATGGITEIISHGKNGLLFAPGQTWELARHISTLYSDPNLCDRLANKGRQTVLQQFSSARMIKAIQLIYEDVLNNQAKIRT